MNSFKLIVITCLIFIFNSALAQNTLVLQHKIKSNRQKIIKAGRHYEIKTKDTLYYSDILNITDSSFSIIRSVNKGETKAITYNFHGKDSTIKYPVYSFDTLSIPFNNIISLKKNLFNNRRWLEPFAAIGLGSGVGIVLVPIAAFASGEDEGVEESIAATAIMFSVCASVVFIGTRKTNYDLNTTWTLKSVKAIKE